MNAPFRHQLYSLALSQRDEKIPYLRPHAEPFDENHLPIELHQLACSTRGSVTLGNADILPAFFTRAAIRMLVKMPNLYWFWSVVVYAVTADDGDKHKRLGKASIQNGVKNLRRDYARRFDLTKPLAMLADEDGNASREAQIAARATAGLILILVKDRTRELHEIRDNPLFFDTTFTK